VAVAALDPDAEIDSVDLASGMEELKRRLERLLGKRPDAPVSQSMYEHEVEQTRRNQIATSAGTMLVSAFEIISQMLPEQTRQIHDPAMAEMLQKSLKMATTQQEDGKLNLTFTLPDEKALTALSTSMAQLLTLSGQSQ
jgi:hypothetical protein